jgi:hypothetical protein
MVDVDSLLYGPIQPFDGAQLASAFAEVADFNNGEVYTVELIRRYLITDNQRQSLFERGACEHDLLNGRIENFDSKDIFADWNSRLGQRVFGA